MRRNGGARELSLGLQIADLAVHFPQFRFERNAMSWLGHLQPTESSPNYRIKISYRPPRVPQTWVLNPVPQSDAKHRYSDTSLCLYDHRVGEWNPGLFLSETIVPWTAEWLFYYEAWLIDPDKRWFGPEAPHGAIKSPSR